MSMCESRRLRIQYGGYGSHGRDGSHGCDRPNWTQWPVRAERPDGCDWPNGTYRRYGRDGGDRPDRSEWPVSDLDWRSQPKRNGWYEVLRAG